MVDIIIDANGNERRCGSLPMPANRVSSLPPFGSAPNQPLWTDEQCREVVTDPSRMPSRELFGPEWILDQLLKSSCNGHALAAGGARARFIRGERDGMLFSGSFPYAQMKADGTDPGSIIEDDIVTCQEYGFLPLSRGPANKIDRRDYTAADYAEAKKHTGLEAYRLVGDWATKMRALRTALANRYCVVVAVMAGDRFSRVDSKGVAGVDNGMGNHACCVQDLKWDGSRWMYDLVNSWNVGYGVDGCAWTIDAHYRQTLGPHEFVVIPSINTQ